MKAGEVSPVQEGPFTPGAEKVSGKGFSGALREEQEMFDAMTPDVSKVNKWEALGSLTAMFGVTYGIYSAVRVFNPEARNPAVPRQLPYNGAAIALGADPESES